MFALIQSVREAQAEGEADAYDYQEDEGNWDDEEAVPDEAPPADDEDEYEDEWGQEDERGEGGEEEEEDLEEHDESAEENDPAPPPPKKAKLKDPRDDEEHAQEEVKPRKKRNKALSRGVSLCSEDPATPARPLPRASTDESYAEIPTVEKEKELADILGQIQQLNVILSSRRFVDCNDSI